MPRNDDIPKTIMRIRIKGKYRNFVRDLIRAFIVLACMAGLFGALAGIQYMVCQSERPGMSFIKCIEGEYRWTRK